MILSTSRKTCCQAKSSIFSGSWSKTQKWKIVNSDQNRIYPSLTLQTAKLFPFKRVLKNAKWWSKSNLPLSHVLPDCKLFPFKRVFLKCLSKLKKRTFMSIPFRFCKIGLRNTLLFLAEKLSFVSSSTWGDWLGSQPAALPATAAKHHASKD